MKINSLILAVSILVSSVVMVQGGSSGIPLKAVFKKQIVDECECEAMVISMETARYYAYKVQSTTNLNKPEWTDEISSITAMDTNLSIAMHSYTSGNKFFRIEELGEGSYVSISTDPNSPLTSSIQVSTNDTTSNMPLIIYGLKSHLTNGIVRNMLIEMVATSPTNDNSYVFSAIKLKVGGLTYFGQVVSTSGKSEIFPGVYGYGWKIQFSNMTIPLPEDTYVPTTIAVDINQNTNNALNGIKVFIGSIIQMNVEDVGYRMMSTEKGPASGAVLTLVGN